MQNTDINTLKGKNWVATLMLCWMFGCFGAHRFYTGKTTSAWIMCILTLSTVFSIVSLIWALFDGIMISLNYYKTATGEDLYERIPLLANFYIFSVISIIILGALVFALLSVILNFINSNLPIIQNYL